MDGREELWSGICFLSFCETSGEWFGEFCFAATANLLEIQIPEICIGISYCSILFIFSWSLHSLWCLNSLPMSFQAPFHSDEEKNIKYSSSWTDQAPCISILSSYNLPGRIYFSSAWINDQPTYICTVIAATSFLSTKNYLTFNH